MVRTTVLLALASVATSCGDDGPQPVQFAEHCSTHDPVRLLELQPDPYWQTTTVLGDRLYHTLSTTIPATQAPSCSSTQTPAASPSSRIA
jgi:hypothetical protein